MYRRLRAPPRQEEQDFLVNTYQEVHLYPFRTGLTYPKNGHNTVITVGGILTQGKKCPMRSKTASLTK